MSEREQSTNTFPSQSEGSDPDMAQLVDDSDTSSNNSDHEHIEGGGYWCHQCQSEISPLMDSGTPTCPQCHSEFVEEIEEDNDPREFVHSDEDDHQDEFYVFGGAPPAGMGLPREGDRGNAGDIAGLIQQWLGQILQPQPGAANNREAGDNQEEHQGDTHESDSAEHHDEEGHALAAEELGEAAGGGAAAAEGPDGTQPRGLRFTRRPGRRLNIAIRTGTGGNTEGNVPTLDLNAVLELLMGANGGDGTNPLGAFFNMVGNPGDYVFGQRGLDDIITQLMEQAGQRNAPPPAPQDLIKALPRQNVTKADIAAHSECSICQDDYTEGEEVVALPCKHLFHQQCIESWLEVNGTCPVCRYSLVSKQEDNANEGPVQSTSASHQAD
ncbi:uncharacterized protein SPPG_08166 [Spizellomyces punctatus DAOM BR117]|uniref:RING-type E3 ubiquitin transferase n=1 Tax=Spizellomyces punctatus (strain DAOM BR117) TaxID=645134 RepID=A0A0L0H5W1_SPIPD|nr:uncharacterized protein SPPG_08166 [Spizellomyces punctatus DAOM BR117]KNC96582.1 hypothetical protein SPPG_08166 [Spizellomyces punctatus DAOM BR117]|eukprot:XP_016604622.1 hypothetical protein SPPG_08166 [Spizellomyces punctatus DAOM BR117]